MKQRVRWFAMCGIIMAIALSGCAKEKEWPQGLPTLDHSDEAVFFRNGCEISGGYLATTGNGNGIMVYFDYASETMVPMCTKADCDHAPENLSCTAALLCRNANMFCISGGKIWYYSNEIVGDYLFSPRKSMIYCADMTGKNRMLLISV